jgi:hypothetical protein
VDSAIHFTGSRFAQQYRRLRLLPIPNYYDSSGDHYFNLTARIREYLSSLECMNCYEIRSAPSILPSTREGAGSLACMMPVVSSSRATAVTNLHPYCCQICLDTGGRNTVYGIGLWQVQYINSAEVRYFSDALKNVLTTAAPKLAEVTKPSCTGGFVEPAPPFAPENEATVTSVFMVRSLIAALGQRQYLYARLLT